MELANKSSFELTITGFVFSVIGFSLDTIGFSVVAVVSLGLTLATGVLCKL